MGRARNFARIVCGALDRLPCGIRERGLSQEALVDAAGIHIAVLGDLERGAGNPNYETLLRIPRALGMPCPWSSHEQTNLRRRCARVWLMPWPSYGTAEQGPCSPARQQR